MDSDSDPEKSGPAISATAPAAPAATVAPVARVAPAAYTEVQPEALVERTEAMGTGIVGICGDHRDGFLRVSPSLLNSPSLVKIC